LTFQRTTSSAASAQPGVGEHQRGLAHRRREPGEQLRHLLAEEHRLAQRAAEQAGVEGLRPKLDAAQLAQLPAVAGVHEAAVAQRRGVEGEDVRRRRHRPHAEQALAEDRER
jgi:hypothetical protein